MIRVGVADDQALVRDGLRAQLGLVGDMEVVGEASTGIQAVALARRELPDVLLMDVRMPEMDGIEATRQICADTATRSVCVVVLTTFDEDENVYAAVRAGASGFLLKDVTPEALHEAIRACAAGEAVVAPAVTRRLLDEIARRPVPGRASNRLADLTPRETEVLVLVAEGLSNSEISGRLFLSPATTKTHVSRVLTKLGARDRAQLVAIAYETGLIRPTDG
ncbi:MAG TPA: response regulator transcription factor [Actinomycetes bacterium]|nr:response regulator transcription factor [Actinomycetes bacterium]